MLKACTSCGQTFQVTDDDLAFYEKVSPVFRGNTYLIPPPTHCPDCRQQRRWAFQNQRFLYHRKSDATGKDIISAYSPEKRFPVYEKAEWLKIDNMQFGRDYDFSRPFFNQFGELFSQTIKEAVSQSGEMVNTEYAHFVGWHKNCYLIFDAGNCEECLYGTFMGYCKYCVDTLDMQRNELCYDCVDLNDCYNVLHGTFCRNCSFSAYMFDCIGCKNCIGCTNLRNQEYCVFNEPVGKERFQQAWKELFNGSRKAQQTMAERWTAFLQSQPHRAVHNVNSPGCTGDYLSGCQDVDSCYKCVELRDSKYCQYVVLQSHNLHDISSFGESLEFSYELGTSGGLVGRVGMNNCCFGAYLYYGGSNIYYSIQCLENCKNLFGCCDVRGKQYCILNKQFTKDEYEALVPKIIEHMRSTGEWGEFFPMTLSPFCYNETVAPEYFPLSKEQVLERGLHWKDADPRQYLPATCALPDNISDVSDGILKETLACAVCSKNYRVIARELKFYRDMHLPVPDHCIDCRYLGRIARRNPQKLWQRACAKCGKETATSYGPDGPRTIYCERCYLETIY